MKNQTKFTESAELVLQKGHFPRSSQEYVSNCIDKNTYKKVGELGIPQQLVKYGMYDISAIQDIYPNITIFVQTPKGGLQKAEKMLSGYGSLTKAKESHSLHGRNEQTLRILALFILLLGIFLLVCEYLWIGTRRKTIAVLTGLGLESHEVAFRISGPLAVIINPTMDPEFIGSEMTFAQYIQGESRSEALQCIAPELKKAGAVECIGHMRSVYEAFGQQVDWALSMLRLYGTAMIGAVLLIILLLVYRLTSYYRINFRKISVHILNGRSGMILFSKSSLIQAVTTMAAAAVAAALHSLPVLFAGTGFAFAVTALTLLYGKLLTKKNIGALKKGR